MQFLNPDQPLTEPMIAACEATCRLRFPPPLRECYLRSNGGEPDPYVFENDELDTVVSEFLPLSSSRRKTAVQKYQDLVLAKEIVPPEFFPFAVDGGGDFFFINTKSANGEVFFFRSDTDEDDKLVALNLGVEEFWDTLKPE